MPFFRPWHVQLPHHPPGPRGELPQSPCPPSALHPRTPRPFSLPSVQLYRVPSLGAPLPHSPQRHPPPSLPKLLFLAAFNAFLSALARLSAFLAAIFSALLAVAPMGAGSSDASASVTAAAAILALFSILLTASRSILAMRVWFFISRFLYH